MGKDVERTPFVRFPRSFGGFAAKTWPYSVVSELYTAQMSALMVVCGPHLPLAFQFVCGPGGGGAANKVEGKWKVSLCLVAPPQAAAGYSINSRFCWRTTFEDICAVRKEDRPKMPF